MKTAIRIAAFLLALLVTVLSICGCESLEEARYNHGYYQDGDIYLNGDRYVYIETSCLDNYNIDENFDRDIFITEQDVPLLLRKEKGDLFRISRNGTLLLTDDDPFVFVYPVLIHTLSVTQHTIYTPKKDTTVY